MLSLFALLFAYDAICGEKERGTLRLCFSYGISRSSFLTGKIAGALGALILPFLIPVGLGALIWIVQGIPLTAVDWLRVLILVFAGFLYASWFLSLAVWVSCITERSSHAFLLLLCAWVFLVLLAPRAAVALSAHQVSVLSTDVIQAENSRLRSQLWRSDRKQMQQDMRSVMQGSNDQGMGLPGKEKAAYCGWLSPTRCPGACTLPPK